MIPPECSSSSMAAQGVTFRPLPSAVRSSSIDHSIFGSSDQRNTGQGMARIVSIVGS
ncbi:hypothetical protein M6B38_180135 [Iris pallida]|uniref:Uncharacterized protein n=1 Tax=Iris pallida TaxID=29817 RepID=A0AAX6EN80_IRIPA|nr:hypothetical protein M6B38_180135 [Iris pallida]